MRLPAWLLLGLVCASAQAVPAAPAPLPPPAPPPGLIGSWSTARIDQARSPFVIVDPVGANSIVAPAWLRLDGNPGFFLDGSQSSDVRLPREQAVSPDFTLGIDLNPAPGGVGSQTVVWLFGFCELRYESEWSKLSFIVWQAHSAPAGDARRSRFTRVERPLAPGKWHRVVASVSGDKIRLEVNGSVVEQPLPGGWDLAPARAPVLLGNSGDGTRPYYGRLDHLFFAGRP